RLRPLGARAPRRRPGRLRRARPPGARRLLPASARPSPDRLSGAEAGSGGGRRERLLAARRPARPGDRARTHLARRVTATRETFAGMGDVEKALWYLAALVSTAAFAYGVWRLLERWRSGRGAAPRPRIGPALRIVLTHAWIRRRAG